MITTNIHLVFDIYATPAIFWEEKIKMNAFFMRKLLSDLMKMRKGGKVDFCYCRKTVR